MPSLRTKNPAVAATLALVLLGGASLAACSSDDAGSPSSGSSPLPTFTRAKPASTGASCDDGTGDIIDDASAATEGTLREPAGIDLVHVEANLQGDLLEVKAVTVGAWGSATNPALSIVQGDPMTLPDRSWELRFLSETGAWRAEVITFPTAPGQQQKNKPLSVPVQVSGNTLSASVPAADLPVIGTTQWLFGSSAGVADATRLIDDCLPFLKSTSDTSVPGTSFGPGTVVDVPTTAPITGKVGTAVLAPDGSEVTVRKIEDPARPNRPGFDLEAFPSTHLMGIEVSVCARGRTVEKVGEQRFTVFVEGQTVGFTVWPAPIHPYDPRFTKKEDTTASSAPAASTTLLPLPVNLAPGQCELGWITFQIPDRLPVSKVVYDASTSGAGPFVTIEP